MRVCVNLVGEENEVLIGDKVATVSLSWGGAEDFMSVFSDQSIKVIFSCIGGDDSVRMLPYIDFDIIRNNPKIFIGYSDSTIAHFMCLKGNLSSFYGPSILAEFGENIKIFDYTKYWLEKTFFENSTIGTISIADMWKGLFPKGRMMDILLVGLLDMLKVLKD